MATKTISIREDVYDLLKNMKKENESFSDVIGRLTNRRKTDIGEYFGALKDTDKLISRDRDFLEISKVTGLEIEVY